MGSGIAAAIINGLLKAAFGYLQNLMEQRGLINQGRQVEAALQTAKTAESNERVAQAVSDAPHSRGETLDALERGRF